MDFNQWILTKVFLRIGMQGVKDIQNQHGHYLILFMSMVDSSE